MGAGADAFTIEPGKTFNLEVYDSRNRLVHQQKITLGGLGTFHTNFVLPAGCPQGQYRVLLHDEAQQSYQGGFGVREYQVEPVQLTVDTPRRVYYRGEEIEGTIRAAFYYGAPLAGRELTYQLSDGRLNTTKTDARGEVHSSSRTRDFAESQALRLDVVLPERNVHAAVNFFLATEGFSIVAATVRPVYLAGESFEVTLTARDAEGNRWPRNSR